MGFPVGAVKGFDDEVGGGGRIETSKIDAKSVWVRAGHVKGLHSALGTEKMIGGLGMEAVTGEPLLAGLKLEVCGRNNHMQKTLFSADGTIAFQGTQLIHMHAEAYLAAVASSVIGSSLWHGHF